MTSRLVTVLLLCTSSAFCQTIDELTNALAQGSDSVHLLLDRARLYIQRGDLRSALSDLELIHDADVETQTIVEKYEILLLQELGRSETAIERCRELILFIPNEFEPHVMLGDLLMSIHDTDGALEETNWLIKKRPDNPIGYVMRAIIMAQLEKPKDAKRDLVAAEKGNVEGMKSIEVAQMSTAFNMVEDYNKGKLYAEKSLSNAPRPLAYANLGWALWGLKSYRESITHLTRSIEMQPTAIAYLYRGKSYYELKEYPKAESDLNNALRLDPGLEEPLVYLGYIQKAR